MDVRRARGPRGGRCAPWLGLELAEESMSEAREIRCYECIERPYSFVSRAFAADPTKLFRRALHVPAPAPFFMARMHVSIAGIAIDRDMRVEIKKVDTESTVPMALVHPATCMDL